MYQSDAKIESYPPLFRQSCPNQTSDSDHHLQELVEQQVVHPIPSDSSDEDTFPVIDLQCIDHGKLGEACEDWGMFRLVNHGIPLALLNQLDEKTRELFSLNFETKQGLFTSGPISYFWGTPALTPSGVVIKRGALAKNLNWVEGLNVLPLGQTLLVQEDYHHHHHMVCSFRVVLEEYRRHLYRIAVTLYEAMEKKLQLGSAKSKSYLSPETGLLRIYRYPPCLDPQQPWGMDAHTDSSVLSILNQDQVGGLQVYKDHAWFDVKPIPTTLIVNLGDMMQALSDDKYMSARHRVKVNKQRERISIGYFVFPEDDAVIESSRYKPFSYADFRAHVQLDAKNIGFKVGLSRFERNGSC